MSKLRVFYIVSLVILVVLTVFTVFRPMAASGKYGEVARESLLETEDEWIIQFDITNQKDRDTEYNVKISVGGQDYREQFLVRTGGIYRYIHRIRRDMVGADQAIVTIYKEGSDTPFEQATYYLK
ncbi:MAG: hypothetical protein HW402_654 [Dehalococcoidales bacterium]|nr:hypothetical protein [Dehalococcoidales bacterium]